MLKLKQVLSDRVVRLAGSTSCFAAIQELDREFAEFAIVMDGERFAGALGLCDLLRCRDDKELSSALPSESPPWLLGEEPIETAIPLLTQTMAYVAVRDEAANFLGIVTSRSLLQGYSQQPPPNGGHSWEAETPAPSPALSGRLGYMGDGQTLPHAILSALMDTTQAIIVLLNPDGRIQLSNRQFSTMTGYSREEAVGLDWFETFIPSRERKRIRSLFLSACKDQRTTGNINPVTTRDGREIEVEWFDQRLMNDKGEFIGLLAIGTDVSDRLTVQRKLVKNELTFRAFVEHAPFCVHEITGEGKITRINSAGLRMLSQPSVEAVIGTYFWEWCPPGDQQLAKEMFANALETGEADFEVRPVVRGSQRVFSCRLVVVNAPDTGSSRIFGYSQDVTAERTQQKKQEEMAAELEIRVRQRTADLEHTRDLLANEIAVRTRAESDVRAVEKKYRTLFEQSPNAVVLLDPETTLPLHFNQATLDLLGYSAEEFRLLPVNHYEANQSEEEIRENVGRVLAEGRGDFETKMRTRNGEVKDVRVMIRVIELEGRPLFHNVFQDISELRQTVRKLHQSQTQYETLFQHAGDGLFVSDGEGNYIDVNRRGCEMVGFKRDELLDMNLRELACPEELPENPIDFDKIRRGEPVTNQRLLRKKDGTAFHAEITAVGLPDSRLLAIVRDISQRRQMEQALKRSEEQFRMHFMNNPIPIYQWQRTDDDFQLTGFNPAAKQITHGNVEKMLGGLLTHYYADMPEVIADFRRCFETRQPVERQMEYHYRKAIKRAILNVRYVFVQPDTIMVHTEDVTEREVAKRELREAEEFYRVLLSNAFEAVAIIGREGNIKFALPSIERMLGYRLEDLIGKNAYTLVHPDDLEAARQNTERLAASPGEPNHFLTRGIDCNGSVRWLEFTSVNMEDHPVIRGIVSNFRDVTERIERQAQLEAERQKLHDSETRLRNILDSINAIVGLFLPDGTLIELNEAPLRLANLQREDVVGKPFWETYWWSYSTEIKAQLRDYVTRAAMGESVRFDAPARAAGGRMIHVDVMLSPLRDSEGRIVQLIGSAVEITERKEAEIALRASEQRFRTLVGTLPHGVMVTDLTGRITLSNAAHARMHGYAEGELVGRYFWELVAGKDRPEEKREFYQQLVTHQPEPGIIPGRNRKKDGSEIDVRVDWDYLRDTHGALEGVVAVLTDVTQEKRTLSELKASEARLVEAQRIGRFGNWQCDLISGELMWSDEVFRIFGYVAQQFSPTLDSFLEAVHPEDRGLVEQAIRTSENSSQAYAVDHRIVRPDGSVRMVRERGESFCDESNTPVRMVGTVQDITAAFHMEQELRAQRDRLSHMNRLSTMGEMATGIAHELNQPLTAIANHSYAARQGLQGEFPDMESIHSDLRAIQQQAIRAGEIIRRLRSFIKPHERDDSEVQLGEIVDNVLTMFAAELRLAEITVEVELESPLPSVKGDSLQLEQVLVNLIKNSHEALLAVPKASRKIELAAIDLTDRIELLIRDHGPGIPPPAAESLFEPFQSAKIDGMGLGLVISRSIIEDHGGRLELRSNSPDGVEFAITLPVKET